MTSPASLNKPTGAVDNTIAAKLRVLIEIVHPADVLFFLHPLRKLRAAGATIRIASRHKDLATQLLDSFGLEHTVLSDAGHGALGLAHELTGREYRLWKMVRDFRPHVMAGFGGVAISHVGVVCRVPTVSFYDSEHAKLQINLALPFITEWHVPACWQGVEKPGRFFRFAGYKELSYFHPENFVVDDTIAAANGWRDGRECFFIRIVEFRASHDFGKRGMDVDDLRRLVSTLSARGDVVISAETALPDDLQRYEFRGDITSVHHLLARCRLYIGESATMAAEAAVLGVPGIFTADFYLGYIREMEQAGMVRNMTGPMEDMLAAVDEMLADPTSTWHTRRDRMLDGKVNVADYVTDTLARVGQAQLATKQT